MSNFAMLNAGIQRLNSNRVLRGGSWINNARNLRSANRNANTPDNRNHNIGLRVAGALLSIFFSDKKSELKEKGGSINQLSFPFERVFIERFQQNQDPQCVSMPKAESLLLGCFIVSVFINPFMGGSDGL